MAESNKETYTALYVLSILATIFFYWLPCSFIGLAHVMAARADFSRGSYNLARKKRTQAMCWTGWACGLGFGFAVIMVIVIAITLTAGISAEHTAANAYSNAINTVGKNALNQLGKYTYP